MLDPEVAENILLPAWKAVVADAFTLRVIRDHLLIPGVRWSFARHACRVVDEPAPRLHLQIPNFQWPRRQDFVDRLACDPNVMESVEGERSGLGSLEQTPPAADRIQGAGSARRHYTLPQTASPYSQSRSKEEDFISGTFGPLMTPDHNGYGRIREAPTTIG